MAEPLRDPGSFRDPTSSVFLLDGAVYRGLAEPAARAWKELRATEFFAAAVQAGRIVRTEEAEPTALTEAFEQIERIEQLEQLEQETWSTVLRHERIPVVSYPYEWSFSMLRDAAALHLDVLYDALGEGFTMKDGYAYNVQFVGARPVFIDVGSFEPGASGPWAGYRQFCQTFLYPLMLMAYRGVDHRPWMRGSVEGIRPDEIRALMTFRDNFRAGVVKHVKLHAAMASRFAERAQDTKSSLEEAGFGSEMTRATAKNLRKTVGKLDWRGASHWSDYHDIAIYQDADRREKEACVREAAEAAPGGVVLDLGCNDGTYSLVAAEHAEYVVAVDGDHAVIDAFYRRLRDELPDVGERVLPMVMDLTDPSPGLGWRNVERRAFGERVEPSLVLALALVHHLVITGNVPVADVVSWLRSFDAPAVVEVPHRDDPFVERLLANKPPGTHDDYTRDGVEGALRAHFGVDDSVTLPCGTRTLYSLRP